MDLHRIETLKYRDAEVEKGYLLAVQPKSPLYLYKAWNCRTILIPGRIGRMQSVFFFFFSFQHSRPGKQQHASMLHVLWTEFHKHEHY